MVFIPDKSGQRPWQSYLRFSLRGLVILVLLCGGYMGWVANRRRASSGWRSWRSRNREVAFSMIGSSRAAGTFVEVKLSDAEVAGGSSRH